MDRSFWLSLMALGLAVGTLLGLRVADDTSSYLLGRALAVEIEQLKGAPSSEDLATRTTEAAGCIYGFQPPVRSCWYAWAHPERPQYLALIAQRIQDDAGGSALGYLSVALPFWLLAAFSARQAMRPRRRLQPSLARPHVDPGRSTL